MSSTISQPSTTVNIIPAASNVQNTPHKVLFVGQMLSVGTATAGTLYEQIGLDKTILNTLFGEGSMIAEMINSARELNGETRFDVIPLDDDGGAAAAAGDITFAGTATANGEFTVNIGSRDRYSVSVPVALGDTADTVGATLEAAVTALTIAPFEASNTTGTVTLTAKNLGAAANFIGLEITGSAAGVTGTVTGVSGGTTDPDLTSVLDVIGEERYQTIVWPYVSDIETVKDFLDARFNVNNDIQDGVAIVGTNEATESALSLVASIQNSQSLVILGDKSTTASNYVGPSILETPANVAAEFAAIRALRLTDGANISQFVLSQNGALDSIGGAALASKPYFNTVVPTLSVGDTGKGFTKQEIENLHDSGITIIGNNRTNTDVLLGEVVTTYKTDQAANPDISFRYLNYVDTSSQAREYFSNNLRARFGQSRLTEGDLVKGRDIANAESIAAYCTGLYADLSGPDYVLLQAGEEALQYFKNNLTVSVDLATGTATITMKVPLVTQFRNIVATMQISFSVN